MTRRSEPGWWMMMLFCGCLLACGRQSEEASSPAAVVESPAPVAPDESGEVAEIEPQPTVVFLGDSLTAGYGLEESQAFPFLIAEMLEEREVDVRVVNAGVSGDTSAGGLRRLDWLLRQQPAVLILALGANDGLRGLPLEDTEANLREIVSQSQNAGARVILAGMKVPPNYGPDYIQRFEAMYPRLAAEFELPLVEFLLAEVAGKPELNQVDGIHPNEEGQRLVAQNVFPSLIEVLGQIDLGH